MGLGQNESDAKASSTLLGPLILSTINNGCIKYDFRKKIDV